MASSILRFIRRRSAAAAAGISRSGSRMMTTTTTTTTTISPWLTLPEDCSAYKFYSLADDKVVTIKKQPPVASDIPMSMSMFASSRGWLELIGNSSRQSFLFNPISGRHIRLPGHDILPVNLLDYLILSPSPAAAALLTLDAFDHIRVCCRGSEWTTFTCHGRYKSLAYSSRRRRLFSRKCKDDSLACFDLTDPASPATVAVASDATREIKRRVAEAAKANRRDVHLYLVVEERSDRLFVVARRVMPKNARGRFKPPIKTLGFEVYEIDWEGEIKGKMEGCLDGLAMFVGGEECFAVAAAAAGLKPDSIYFTADNEPYFYDGEDVGVFNYVDKKISSIYYSYSDVPFIDHSPKWFTPTCLEFTGSISLITSQKALGTVTVTDIK